MKKSILSASILSALAFNAFAAAPTAPRLDNQYNNYTNKGFVTVYESFAGSSAYNHLVNRVDVVELPVTWIPASSGDAATSWQLLINGEVVTSGTGPGSNAIIPITSGGLKEIVVRVCNNDGCTDSTTDTMVVSDTDGSHLQPLIPQVDDANINYAQSQDQVVATYFLESDIYGDGYFVKNIPANNLTHIIYGFVPMCGENRSFENDDLTGWNILQANCAVSQDYELVIHDTWAAIWQQYGAEKPLKLDGKALGQGELGTGNLGQLMALKQGNPHLKIIPSVGGATLSDPFYGFTDKANRDTFVASSKEFLKTWKLFDGLDINWQFPGGGGANTDLGDPVNDGPAYVALMQELRVMLDELSAETGRQYELTSAIGVDWDKLQDVDYAAAAQYIDNIFMKSYDFYGTSGSETGHQTALYCDTHVSADKCAGTGEFGPSSQMDKSAADYAPAGRPENTIANATRLLIEQGVPAKKLVVGTAMYGRGWSDVQIVDGSPIGALGHHINDATPLPYDNNTDCGGMTDCGTVSNLAWTWKAAKMDYRGALKYLEANQNAQYVWDDQAQASFIWDDVKNTLITLDTPQSIAAKGVFLKEQGLGGLFSSNIAADGGDKNQRLLNAINLAVGNAEGITDWGVTANLPPEVQITMHDGFFSGDKGSVSAMVKDSDGSIVSVTATANGKALALTKSGDIYAGEFKTKDFTNTIVFTATDNEDAVTTKEMSFESGFIGECPNFKPPVNGSCINEDLTLSTYVTNHTVNVGEPLEVMGTATDASTPFVSVTVNGEPAIIAISVSLTSVSFSLTQQVAKLGDNIIVVTAKDDDGEIQTETIVITGVASKQPVEWEGATANGTLVSYQGKCFRAKNNPGKWETPKAGSWFWDEEQCPTTVVTPTPPPTPTPAIDEFYHSILYKSDAGKNVYAHNGVVELNGSQSTWKAAYTYDYQPAEFGQWKALTVGAPAVLTKGIVASITLEPYYEQIECATPYGPLPAVMLERQFEYQLTVGSSTDTMILTQSGHPICAVEGESDWDASATYNKGDEVVVDGITYVAGWWTKGEEPGTTGDWGVWKEVK